MTATVRRILAAEADQLEAKLNSYLSAHPTAKIAAIFAAPGGDIVVVFEAP